MLLTAELLEMVPEVPAEMKNSLKRWPLALILGGRARLFSLFWHSAWIHLGSILRADTSVARNTSVIDK